MPRRLKRQEKKEKSKQISAENKKRKMPRRVKLQGLLQERRVFMKYMIKYRQRRK
jgi:hypothetical protein